MRFSIAIFLVIITGLLISPVFVHAGADCYVDADADADSGGDGSKENPYIKISKALEKDCKDISIKTGTYSNDIILENGVEIEGESRDDVVITGKVTMKDNSEIGKVTIKGEGVYVSDNADVEIVDVIIKNSGIGIETLGGGNLMVKNSEIFGNRKGFYIQAGKNINITSSNIYNNTEEGVDIRSNVDGIISGNIIEENGEGGIEVVLGKSELTISNNKIRHNHASGIATQFYDFASELGGIKINNNTISGNSDFAVTCKIPSGGKLSANYWSKSVSFIGNKIDGNKDGVFAPSCNFSNLEIINATKTKEELEVEEQVRLEILEKLKEDPGKSLGSIKINQTASGHLNLRAGSSISNEIIGSVKSGEEYEYAGKENGWYKTIVSDSLWGWVSGDYVEEIIIKEEIQQEEKEEEITTKNPPKEEILGEVQKDDKRENNDTIIFGFVITILILFLIFLFSPLPDKIFGRKKEIVIPTKGRDDINIDNF